MPCIHFNNKPTHSQQKTRPSNQSFGTCKTMSLHQALQHKTTILLHRSRSPTSPLLSRRAAREVTAHLETTKFNGKRTSTGSTGQQRARTSATPPKPAVCNAANNPAENDAGRQTGSDQWPRGQHEPCHRYLASSASGRAPGCPRRDQRPTRWLVLYSRTCCSLVARARTSASLA